MTTGQHQDNNGTFAGELPPKYAKYSKDKVIVAHCKQVTSVWKINSTFTRLIYLQRSFLSIIFGF